MRTATVEAAKPRAVAAHPPVCTCSVCREKFPRGKSGSAKGMCPACYRRSLPDRVDAQRRADVEVVREAKAGLDGVLSEWLEKRAATLGVSEAEVIRVALHKERLALQGERRRAK